MNRLRRDDFEAKQLDFELHPVGGHRLEVPVAGLLIACSTECFAAEALEAKLSPGAWLVHRTPGNIVPTFGAGHVAEEEILERAVTDFRVRTVVVCGHHPCGVVAHLLVDGAPHDDFVLRDWLSHAEAARRVVRGLNDAGRDRTAATHNVLAQLANLRTHPAVAAAQAQGRLELWGWLHAGELLGPGTDPFSFSRPVALHPDQNRTLRRECVLLRRRSAPSGTGTPYLA
ncbi:MAG: hypothetical protein K2R98_06535 [Gemmataceae bacterium]|nr:hypothetical protein [Gemmataceae bacterium]